MIVLIFSAIPLPHIADRLGDLLFPFCVIDRITRVAVEFEDRRFNQFRFENILQSHRPVIWKQSIDDVLYSDFFFTINWIDSVR